jgi:hypothetical protein
MTKLYRKVESAGGKVTVGPMRMMTAGRMTIFAETADAVIAVWQPGQHLGAQLVDEPGASVWSDLSSSDLPKSKCSTRVVRLGLGRRRRLPRSARQRPHHRRALAPASGLAADVPDNSLVWIRARTGHHERRTRPIKPGCHPR